MKTDVLIIGCGLNGLLLAKNLEHHNINTIIIECNKIDSIKNDNRCIALSHQTQQILLNLNIWNKNYNEYGIINDIYISCANSLLHYDNKKITTDKKPLGYTVPYENLKKILLNSVLQSKKITILEKTIYTNIQISSSIVTVNTSNNLTIKTPLVVCAEGKKSKLCNAINIKNHIFDYKQFCITFNIIHTYPNENTAFERFNDKIPFALLPTANKFKSSLIMLISQNYKKNIINMNEQTILKLINKILPRSLGNVIQKMEQSCFPLTLNVAKKYYKKRIVLIGDTLHSIHPITGQGFNISAKDALSLANILKESIDNNIDIGSEEVLSKFYKNRKINNSIIINYTDKMIRAFSNKKQILPIQQLISASLNVLNKSTDIKTKIIDIINKS